MNYADIDGEATEVHSAPLAVQHSAPVAQTFFSAMRPAEKVAFATEVADALRPILDQKKLVKHLNTKNPDDEYVELEGWQTCAAMCNMAAKIEWTRKLEDGSGYEARAVVVRTDTGIEVGAGESECSTKEWKWKGRDDYARKGMAQTRAQSRALRGVLAWILVLAGYTPTPAEEMPGAEDSAVTPTQTQPEPPQEPKSKYERERERPLSATEAAKLKALMADEILIPAEISAIIAEVMDDPEAALVKDIKTVGQGRLIAQKILAKKREVQRETPL